MNNSNEQFTWPQAFAWAIAIFAILASSILMADEVPDGGEKRITENAFYADSGRDQTAPNKVSRDELAALSSDSSSGSTSPSKSGLRSSKTTSAGSSTTSSAPNTDFWIYSADVELFGDSDRDGYFSGIDLLFDADTYFSRAEVFAVVYLSYEGGDWTEYAETETFVINGSSGTDEYVIVSDLVAGYPAGSYDILIELFDDYDGSFVADIGPENTSELAFLPLEDSQRDSTGPVVTPVVVNHGGGGGAADLFTVVLLLMATAVVAVRRRREPASLAARPRGPFA